MQVFRLMTVVAIASSSASPAGAQMEEQTRDLVAVSGVKAVLEALRHDGPVALSGHYITTGQEAESVESSSSIPTRLVEKLDPAERLASFSDARVCPGSPRTCYLSTDSDVVVAISRPDLSGERPSVHVLVARRTDSTRTPVSTARYLVEVTVHEGVPEVASIRVIAQT